MIVEMLLPEPPVWAIRHDQLQRSRRAAAELQRYRCVFCNCKCWMGEFGERGPKKYQGTAEHVVPKKDGGTNARSNILLACHQCNQERGTRPVLEYWAIRSNPQVYAEWRAARSRKAQKSSDKRRRKINTGKHQLWMLNYHLPFFSMNLREPCTLQKLCRLLPGEMEDIVPSSKSQQSKTDMQL